MIQTIHQLRSAFGRDTIEMVLMDDMMLEMTYKDLIRTMKGLEDECNRVMKEC